MKQTNSKKIAKLRKKKFKTALEKVNKLHGETLKRLARMDDIAPKLSSEIKQMLQEDKTLLNRLKRA